MLNKDKTVKTIDGVTHPREKCRKIQGEFYLIGDPKVKDSGQCYLVSGTYYRITSDLITYDYEVEKYVKNSDSNLINGFVGIENGKLIAGSFSPNEVENIQIAYGGSTRIGLNDKIFGKSKMYRERLTDGIFFRYDAMPAKRFSIIGIPESEYKNSLQYTCDGLMPQYIKSYEKNYKPKQLYTNVAKYGDFAEDYTFGVEFETIMGTIPERICKKHGLMPVRDGSVAGLEYVTIPLTGKLGLNNIIDVSKQLANRTINNSSCSMHIHIGNIPRTQSFLLAFYKLVATIQDEIFEMFPVYKRTNYGIKKKNYTKPLPIDILTNLDPVITKGNMSKNFKILFDFLSMGANFDEYGSLSKVTKHPSDPNGTSKWQIKSRYYHVNMIPIVFGNKKTIEFRIHTATDDANKIINFLAMWIGILNFVKHNETMILSKSYQLKGYGLMNYVSNGLDSSVASAVMTYIKNRKRYISHCMQTNNVRAEESEFRPSNSIMWARNTSKASNIFEKKSFDSMYESMMGHITMPNAGGHTTLGNNTPIQ